MCGLFLWCVGEDAMRWAVIMAGGNGTRFWPLSTPTNPKQFLCILGNETPSGACIRRVSRVVERERIVIVASEEHREALHAALPDFPAHQVLWEPVGRNTAACIAWATETILRQDAEALIGVFPSDHAIRDEVAFASALDAAYARAEGRIVLFGIAPTRPETGYGYIRLGKALSDGAFEVSRFCEKPNSDVAQEYVASGEYVWNSGMFIYDGGVMRDEIRHWLPELASGVEAIVDHPETLHTAFARLYAISIDYGVMERTQKAAVMRAVFDWDDVGTWEAIRRYYPCDEQRNAGFGDYLVIDSHDVFTYAADGRLIAVLGLNHVIAVSTKDAVLVMADSRSQDVRKFADKLKNDSNVAE